MKDYIGVLRELAHMALVEGNKLNAKVTYIDVRLPYSDIQEILHQLSIEQPRVEPIYHKSIYYPYFMEAHYLISIGEPVRFRLYIDERGPSPKYIGKDRW